MKDAANHQSIGLRAKSRARPLISDVRAPMRYANDYSGYGNEVLYRMCSERPLHENIDTIKSKLWIIGRAYSAAIERKAGPDFKIETAAEILKVSEIDSHISRLLKITRTDETNLDTLLCAHKCLTEALQSATGIEKRSLASKYLHFHAPNAVFIFDSIANRKLRELLSPVKKKFACQGMYDDQYEAFVRRAIFFRDNVFERELGALASPRRIDMHLLGYSGVL